MERELQLELLERLVEVHVKNSLFFHLQYTRDELLAMGLKSLSQCLSESVNPYTFVEKLEWDTENKLNEYSQIWAKKIVKDYDQKLRE